MSIQEGFVLIELNLTLGSNVLVIGIHNIHDINIKYSSSIAENSFILCVKIQF